MNYPDDQDLHDTLFPHEFLFLLCNTKSRLDIINKMSKPEFTTEKRNIKKYEMQPLDARRLDKLFIIDENSFKKSGN
jgi:hypothetical protein